ncbi:hypothetical protein ASPNIDRAFT_43714 [Aspergillus niger ATCC 1015]|uniref:Protein kinase domain-containing protein n=1 Tax=Aspergillus niger (strain ATCC 1015 / CBS 113.46 / FGSC A1144 / LSHB Ac4 / NCTC 3858a / NRRL 328 / USDA 3528.7) TaxID=380704 RepID=G3XUP6_ASPNA|nr:hypothetical protein ASPNIDRAFT_43714 [Aspergillus niger ATCC 1015]
MASPSPAKSACYGYRNSSRHIKQPNKYCDFGISVLEPQKLDSSRPLSVRGCYREPTIEVDPHRGRGTYRPPEAINRIGSRAMTNKIGRRSDIWAYGCIFTEVLAWAIGRREGVEYLARERQIGITKDIYWDEHFGQSLSPQATGFKVRDSVVRWLDHIQTSPEKVVGEWVKTIKDILIIDKESRPKAQKLVTYVTSVYKSFDVFTIAHINHSPRVRGPIQQPDLSGQNGMSYPTQMIRTIMASPLSNLQSLFLNGRFNPLRLNVSRLTEIPNPSQGPEPSGLMEKLRPVQTIRYLLMTTTHVQHVPHDDFLLNLRNHTPMLIHHNVKHNNRSALLWAACRGRGDLMHAILRIPGSNFDVSVNVPDKILFVRLLLAEPSGGGTPEFSSFEDHNGGTPRMAAAKAGHLQVVQLLLRYWRVEVNRDNYDDHTALAQAAIAGCPAVVKLLLKVEDIEPDWPGADLCPPLACAAKAGHLEVVKALLQGETRADVRLGDWDGVSLLMWAVRHGVCHVVEFLLDHDDMDVAPQDSYGRTARMWAEECGNQEIVRLFHSREIK